MVNPWKKDPVVEQPKVEAPKPLNNNNPFVKSVNGEITSTKKPTEEVKPVAVSKKVEEPAPKKVEEPAPKKVEEVVRSSVTENKVNNEPPKKL